MSDIVDPENGTYVNRVSVVYHSIESPQQPAPLATVVLVLEAGKPINRDQLRRELEQLQWIRGSDGELSHRPFVSEDRYYHFSWGADAASLAFVISAGISAAQGIVGGASWDGLKAIAKRIHGTGKPARLQPLDDQEAISRAKQMAALAFNGLDSSGFTVLSVSVADNAATVVMRYHPDGSTFTVQPSMLESGGGVIGPIVRAYPE